MASMTNATRTRLSFNGTRYEIRADKSVVALRPVDVNFTNEPTPVSDEFAKVIRAEATRLRRNRAARERSDAYRSLGMVRTPYGWE